MSWSPRCHGAQHWTGGRGGCQGAGGTRGAGVEAAHRSTAQHTHIRTGTGTDKQTYAHAHTAAAHIAPSHTHTRTRSAAPHTACHAQAACRSMQELCPGQTSFECLPEFPPCLYQTGRKSSQHYERVSPHMKTQCSALMGSVDRWFFTRGPEAGSVDRSVDRCFFTRGLRGPLNFKRNFLNCNFLFKFYGPRSPRVKNNGPRSGPRFLFPVHV